MEDLEATAPVARSLAGTWLAPQRVVVEDADGAGRFVARLRGTELRLSVEGRERAATLAGEGGEVLARGRANFALTRIQWDGGSAWSKAQAQERDFSLGEQEYLLTLPQLETVVDRINASVDLPFVPESMERELIMKPVKQANKYLKIALGSFMTEDWVLVIAVLLDQTRSPEARSAEIRSIMRRAVQVPLVDALNARIDIPLLSEKMERKIFEPLVEKLVDEVVALTVAGMVQSGLA